MKQPNKGSLFFCIALTALAATGCNKPRPSIIPGGDSLEGDIERFSGPDEFGVVCYHYKYSSSTLSCVKVR